MYRIQRQVQQQLSVSRASWVDIRALTLRQRVFPALLDFIATQQRLLSAKCALLGIAAKAQIRRR